VTNGSVTSIQPCHGGFPGLTRIYTERLFDPDWGRDILTLSMRVHLSAHLIPSQALTEPQVSLQVRPSCSIPGAYSCIKSREWLLRLLRRETDLPSTVLEKFEMAMSTPVGARLLSVELDDRALTEIGYLVD
jgi:hypothetical protein